MSANKPTLMEKAETRFAEKQKKTPERMQATVEYISEARVRALKTAKLRELRLAKEEAERAAAPPKPLKARTPRAARSVKANMLSGTPQKSGIKNPPEGD